MCEHEAVSGGVVLLCGGCPWVSLSLLCSGLGVKADPPPRTQCAAPSIPLNEWGTRLCVKSGTPLCWGVLVLAVPGKADKVGSNITSHLLERLSSRLVPFVTCAQARAYSPGLLSETREQITPTKPLTKTNAPPGEVCPSARTATSAD